MRMYQILQSVSIALQNIRSNPLHTFLSTLGIIIGVASLVAILALGDGLEQTGREQIETTTSVQMISVTSKTADVINEVRVKRDTVYIFDVEDARAIEREVSEWGMLEMMDRSSAMLEYKDSTTAVYVQASLENAIAISELSIEGRFFTTKEVDEGSKVMVLTKPLAQKLENESSLLIGKKLKLSDAWYEVIGIVEDPAGTARVIIPMTTYLEEIRGDHIPSLLLKSRDIENVPVMKEAVIEWLDQEFEKGSEAFNIFTYERRVEQLGQAILIFKLVMGAITGISVLVGGIGIMNVLLISVTERTKEIGVRKATGAKKKDIVMQFLSESVTISLAGCIVGWLLGLLGVFGLVYLINSLTELNFQAAFSTGTVFVILAVALVVGVVFGTYPAWKAANLTPVEAIRHE